MNTHQRVIDVVAEVLETPAQDLDPDLRFIEDLGATSIDIVNLVWRIEEVFSLRELEESELEAVHTLAEFQDLVARRIGDHQRDPSSDLDVALGADHAGVTMKNDLADWLQERGASVQDMGPGDTNSVDYPDFAARVARAVARGGARRGILICGSGIGMSIAANKVDGIRAVVVTNPLQAQLARRHNDANILCIGQRLTGPDMARECVSAFLTTPFDPGDDGRHQRRVNRITSLESSSPDTP